MSWTCVVDLRDNLVPGIEPGMFESDLDRGKGGKLEGKAGQAPKFHAGHSSAARAVNAFAPWKKEPKSLVLAGIELNWSISWRQRFAG